MTDEKSTAPSPEQGQIVSSEGSVLEKGQIVMICHSCRCMPGKVVDINDSEIKISVPATSEVITRGKKLVPLRDLDCTGCAIARERDISLFNAYIGFQKRLLAMGITPMTWEADECREKTATIYESEGNPKFYFISNLQQNVIDNIDRWHFNFFVSKVRYGLCLSVIDGDEYSLQQVVDMIAAHHIYADPHPDDIGRMKYEASRSFYD